MGLWEFRTLSKLGSWIRYLARLHNGGAQKHDKANDKAGDKTRIIGGVYHGDGKVVQHNGCGEVNVTLTA